MKKIFFALGLMVAATISLTNCSKSVVEQTPAEEDQFSLFAGVDTKTVNDGVHTNWVADDALAVFYVKSNDSQATFSTNVNFSIASSDLAAKRFTTSAKIQLAESANGYDWHAIYPYDASIPSPANKSTKGFITVGGMTQTQTGNNSTAHLCGKACPLYGVVKGVAVGTSPSIQMKNVTSVVEFVVTNSTSKAFKVTKIVFTAGEDIVGTYYIDFTANPVAFVGSGANYVSKNAILTVKDGANLAVGSTAKFYIAIKPFTTTAGLTAKVYAEDADASIGSYTKEIAAASRTFTAGKIKTVNVAVDNLVSEKVYTISEVLAAGATSKHDEVIGTYNTMAPATVMAINNSNVVLKDETGTILFYKSSTGLAVGDVVNYSGVVKNFNGIIEFTGNVAIEKTGTTTVSHNPQAIDGAALEAYISAPVTKCVNFKGRCDNSGYVSLSGTTKRIRLYGTYSSYTSKVVSVMGYAIGSSTASGYASVIITTIEELPACAKPVITLTGASATITCETSGATIRYTVGTNPDDPTSTTGTVYSSAVTLTDGQTIKAIACKTGLEDSEVVSKKYSASGAEPIVLDFTKKTAGNSYYNNTWSYGDWKITYGANNSKGWEYIKLGGKNTTISTSNPCSIAYTKEVTDKISKVTVSIPSGSFSKSGMSVNSWGVYIYSDEKMTTQVDYVAGGTITSSAAVFDFTPSVGRTWKNCYVKAVWDLANTSGTNGIVLVDKVIINF